MVYCSLPSTEAPIEYDQEHPFSQNKFLQCRENEKLGYVSESSKEDRGKHTLLVAAIAMLSSNGCQLMCRIFLLKSIWSASVSLRILPPWPAAPAAGLP